MSLLADMYEEKYCNYIHVHLIKYICIISIVFSVYNWKTVFLDTHVYTI